MQVSDILRSKNSNALYTVSPNTDLGSAASIMATYNIGSLLVTQNGQLCGLLTFYEILQQLPNNAWRLRQTVEVMQKNPITCSPASNIDDIRKSMLTNHMRYMPVVENKILNGVISFYDVAKAVVDSQEFENKMLKAYIKHWPAEAIELNIIAPQLTELESWSKP